MTQQPQDGDRFWVADDYSYDYLRIEGRCWSLDEFDSQGRIEGLVWNEKRKAWTYSKQRVREVAEQRRAAKAEGKTPPSKSTASKPQPEALQSKGTLTVNFAHEKTTSNTHRYKEQVVEGGRPLIGTIYIQKSALRDKAPKTIQVEIKYS